jgi:putative tricarboxylic transport membrane protein
MTNNKSDIIIAIFLLCFSGIMINDTSNIRDLGFEGMKADAWPRVVLWLLVVMSSVMLGKSYIQFKTEGHKDNNIFHVNLSKFKNAIICFGMFLFFLSTLDYLGMLLGGIAFVFGLLTFLGGFSVNLIIRHFVISVLSIGFMWMVFTFGLRVMLPEGEILRVW